MEDNNTPRKRFFPEGIKDYENHSLEQLIDLLSNDSGYIKARALVELSKKKEYEIVFTEIKKTVNQEQMALMGLSVAQVGGLGIVDFGGHNELDKLKDIVNAWTVKYQMEDFIHYLKRNDINFDEITNNIAYS